MDKKLASIIDYFAVFDYFPKFADVYTFFPEKISKKKLKILFEAKKHTPLEYSKEISNRKLKNYELRITYSKKKLNNWRFRAYIKFIYLFPQIKLVGLSGSISMMNADKNDDIDLFIITAKNRLFTGRLIALLLAQLFGLRRSRELETTNYKLRTTNHSNKVCLNLFFDESNLKVPVRKQALFVGHEVLQMKPVIVKGDIYERFLKSNEWVFRLFPNAKQIFNFQFSIFNQFQNSKFKNKINVIPAKAGIQAKIEQTLKDFQLRLINKHKTTEIITSSQLWFHPDDFEKKINSVR